MVRRREIKAAVASKLAARAWTVAPPPVVYNKLLEEHEITSWPNPALLVTYLEERKQIEQLNRRRGFLDLALSIYAVGLDTAMDVCDDIAGEAEAELELPIAGVWLGLSYVRLVEVVLVRPVEQPQGSTGDKRLWFVHVRIQYTHDKAVP